MSDPVRSLPAIVCSGVAVLLLGLNPLVFGQCGSPGPDFPVSLSGRPIVLLTGYWPPTNEIVRPFSYCHSGTGWIGEDWEGRGYDVYSYFPEFSCSTAPGPPLGCLPGDVGSDLRIDYQDTDEDFDLIVSELNPVAIITTSYTPEFSGLWELEDAYFNLATWTPDFEPPLFPSGLVIPSLPSTAILPSTLPLAAIEMAVDPIPGIDAMICPSDSGGPFLSGYIGLKGVAHELSSPDCVMAGHIHVSFDIGVTVGRQALFETLRVVTNELDSVLPGFVRGDVDGNELVEVTDAVQVLNGVFLGGAISCRDAADCNDDGLVDVSDAVYLLEALFVGGPGIPPPSLCGRDPTGDALDCASFVCP